MIPRALNTVVERLGWPGKLAVVLFAGTAVLFEAGLRPLEARSERLDRSIEHAVRQNRHIDPGLVRTASPSAKLATFYKFFEREETTTDWLAKLYAIAEKGGVTLRSAEYRLEKGPGAIDRYEIALPLSGNYAQIRAFLENALIEIPVLSLDQLSFRRKRANDPAVETEARLTLHLLRP